MTARPRKPKFASLLGRAPRREGAAAEPTAHSLWPGNVFGVDPVRVRLWAGGPAAPTPEACRDLIATIARDGQADPVVVRPVFDDRLIEYEVIAGADDYVAVRHLRDTTMPDLELFVRVDLIDDAGAERIATGELGAEVLPGVIREAFAGGALPPEIVTHLQQRIDTPLAPAILATAGQIARAQAARYGDGLPPYDAEEVLRLLEEVAWESEPPPAETLSVAILEAGDRAIALRLDGEEDPSPEMLERLVRAIVDGAAAQGIKVRWGEAG